MCATSQCLSLVNPAQCNETNKPTGTICKLQRKLIVVDMAPAAIFTFCFLCSIQMDQQASVNVYDKFFQSSVMKHTSLLGIFVICKLLWIWSQGPYSQHFVFFVRYKWTNKLACFFLTSLFSSVKFSTTDTVCKPHRK